MTYQRRWIATAEISNVTLHAWGAEVTLELENETLCLKINSQLGVSVPPDCTLSFKMEPASGKVLVTVEADSHQSWVAFKELNRLDTMDQISL